MKRQWCITMDIEIKLHLGAHKTASTHLQKTLQKNSARLDAGGICYIPLARLRTIFTRQLRRAFRSARDSNVKSLNKGILLSLKDELHRRESETGMRYRSLILSDENIFGSLKRLHDSGALYGDCEMRLECLAGLFRGCNVKVIYGIRNYADFYPSAYAELVRDGATCDSFSEFMDRLHLENNSWTTICRCISAAFGEANTRVFRHEDYARIIGNIIEEIAGSSTGIEFDRDRMVRKSLPERGTRAVIALAGILSDQERKRLGSYLATNFEFDPPVEKVAIKDGDLRIALEQKYRQDLNDLSRYLIGV